MSELKNTVPEVPVSPASAPSIQQQKHPERSAPARGEAEATPILYVETQSLENLLERAELDLEAGFWTNAVSYADRALKLDPANSRGILVKFLADLKVTGTEGLKQVRHPISTHPLYRTLMELGSPADRQAVSSANDYICSHLEELYRDDLDEIRHDLAGAQLAPDLAKAREKLENIPSFPAADALRTQCEEKKRALFAPTMAQAGQYAREYRWAEAAALYESISDDEKARVALIDCRNGAEKEARYLRGVEFQEKYQFREAAEAFAALENYRDSAQRFQRCNRMIKGKKVRAVGTRHTLAAWANVFAAIFTAVTGVFTLSPVQGAFFPSIAQFLGNLIWGVPVVVLSLVLSIVKARYRPAKKIWLVLAAVLGLILVLTTTGVLSFGTAAGMVPNLYSGLIYLALTACLIFI